MYSRFLLDSYDEAYLKLLTDNTVHFVLITNLDLPIDSLPVIPPLYISDVTVYLFYDLCLCALQQIVVTMMIFNNF